MSLSKHLACTWCRFSFDENAMDILAEMCPGRSSTLQYVHVVRVYTYHRRILLYSRRYQDFVYQTLASRCVYLHSFKVFYPHTVFCWFSRNRVYEVVRRVRKCFKSGNPQVVMRALDLTDTLMQSCGAHARREVGSDKFLKLMGKLCKACINNTTRHMYSI